MTEVFFEIYFKNWIEMPLSLSLICRYVSKPNEIIPLLTAINSVTPTLFPLLNDFIFVPDKGK